jgi:hypothetical protein
LIAIDNSKSIRIKSIEARSFTWVFEAFAAQQAINGVSPRVLRALLSRSYELVRRDIPRKVIEADFQMLEHAVESQSEFAKLFGLTTISDFSQLAANYPYTFTQLSKKLGDRSKSWRRAQQAVDKVKAEKGIDLKESDNSYHCRINYGKSRIRKYSEAAVVLLKKVRAGESYDINLKPVAPVSGVPTDSARQAARGQSTDQITQNTL